MDTLVNSRTTDTNFRKTTDNNFNSTLLDDGTLFSFHTVNTLIDLENQDNNNISNKKNYNYTNSDTTSNTNTYEDHKHCKLVNSTELTQKSDPLNTTLKPLLSVYTLLSRLQRLNSVQFNTEPVILKNSPQPTITNNQNIQLTP